MKRVIAFLIVVISAFCAMGVSASAATKSDILQEFRKTVVSKYTIIKAENALRGINITPEQGDEIVKRIKEVSAVVNTDKGISAHTYSVSEVTLVMRHISEVCGMLGLRYEYVMADEIFHSGDIVFRCYDAAGKLIFEYDGDLISKTGFDISAGEIGAVSLAGALLIAFAVLLVSKKRSASRAAVG